MYREGPYRTTALTRRWPSIFFLLFLLTSLRTLAQVTDSADWPIVWLRADTGISSGAAWKDFSGHGYDGAFLGSGARVKTLLNFNPAVRFNGVDDSVRIRCNLDSLSEMTYMAVFVPSDDAEEAVWGVSGALLRNTSMSTRRVVGPDSTADTLTTAPGMATLATVLQSWRWNDSVAPSPQAYLMVGAGSVIPPFKGVLAELLVFDRSLDVLTQAQYETYLAIKYGIPLRSGNYVSAGQTVLWNADKNKGYASRIAGLGRERFFSLDQRQSISAVDADSLLVIGSSGDSLATGNYLVWGDNNKGLALSATPDGQLQMTGRQWLMSVSGAAANKINTCLQLNRRVLPPNNYWLVVNPGGYAGFPVDSLLYYFADSASSDSQLLYRNIRWDRDRSGKDLFGLAQARDLLLKLTVLDSAGCSPPETGRARMQAIGGTGPYNYRVMNSTGAVLNSGTMDSSLSVGGLAMGSYSVLLTDSKGHTSLRSLVMPVPKAEQLTIALQDQALPAGGSLLLDASADIASGAALSYQWTGSNGFNSMSPSISVSEPGVYSVAVTSVAGCVFRDTVTISGEAGQRVSVYPSPSADGNFTVSVSLPEAGPISVGIYDLNGNKVQETGGSRNSEYRLPGHLSTPGVYMITVKTPHGVESRKLMIL